MKIVVTGSCGFIGSNLIPYLLNKGDVEVIGIDNLLNPSINPTDRMKAACNPGAWERFRFWNADIRDSQTIHSIFINEKPDYIIHLAALGSVPRSWDQPGLVTDINEIGFINILQAATRVGVKRISFASSSSVYGPSNKNIKWEGQVLFPASPYALSKVQNERFASLWCGNMGMEWIGLRFFNVYGPGQNFTSDYSAVIPRFLTKDKIKVFGDGSTIRDFTYVMDVAIAIWKSLLSKECNDVVNIGTGNGTNLKRLAELCNRGRGKEISYLDERPGDTKISIADTTKLQSMLGVKKCLSIEDGIELTRQFYQSLKIN